MLTYIVVYAAVVVFAVAVIARVLFWSRLPMHVRWELYPVAHEASRAHYGGSYLEETDWWQKPREKSMLGELKAMIPEILFLVALREHNPRLWVRSFPFHFGLYLTVGWAGLMAVAGVVSAVAPGLLEGGFGSLFRYAIVGFGSVGLCLAIIGALGLLQRRLGDPELRDFTAPADIANLLFFLVAFGLTLLTFVLFDRDFSRFTFLVANLVTFKMEALPGAGAEALLPQASLVLMGLLMAYIPLTHMSHFVGKYFAYHAIRWNDQPNLRGGAEEPIIHALLCQPVSWAAPHIKGDGKKTWVDVATEEIKK
ncbi:MAG: respiratory nitrate reductase subunit gamma [Deltaproteobacteria bacterium]|nr:respiratory nitrate reductase subunit gamma [Deltaproteobacteria bacterium]